MINLKDKNALVTGGSAGLGAEVARQLAGKGCNVAINYAHSKQRAEELAAELVASHGVKAVAIEGNVAKAETCQALVDTAAQQLDGLDVVISNAGWTEMVAFQDLENLTEEVWDKCMDMNVKSHYFIFKAARPYFEKNPTGGSFLVSGSIAGLRPEGSSMAYSVSKAALTHLVKCLAKTFGPSCRANIICPGLLLTDWGMRFGDDMIEKIKQGAPLKKDTGIDDCASMFVAMAENDSMTGAVVSVDAGKSVL